MEEEPQEPQKPELSKQGKQEQKRILSSMEEMQDISSEEFDRRVQLGIEKERKKLRWNNLNAGTKFNVILTAVLILTAIVALFFQWKANSTTRENLDLFQKEFELSYRPYISIVNTDINIANDSLQLLFHYNNSGKVPAVVQVERTYGIYNSFDKFSEIIISPGIS